jgi:uncharacterized protein with gpF-like domain
MKLLAPETTALPPIVPSAALCAWYYDQLKRLLDAMAGSMELHILAALKRNEPTIGLAQDASPSIGLKRAVNKWGSAWVSKFDAMSADIAKKFAQRSSRHVDISNAAAFKKAGFTVQFQPTPAAKEAYQAVIGWNVGLIKNLPRDYLDGVQNAVWAGVMKGQDLESIAKTLRERHGMSVRRAALISRDQTSKAMALIDNVRATEAGITHAIWMHSHAVKHPRPSHLAFSGSIYELKKGAYLDGEWVWPHTAIGCRCYYRKIIPGVNDPDIKKLIERERLRRDGA